MSQEPDLENDSLIELIFDDDPLWDPAISSLAVSGDTSALAELLISGQTPPVWVLKQIGIMLSPPSGYAGPELIAKFSKRTREGEIQKLLEKRKIRKRIETLSEKYGKLEAAIAQVMSETGLSRQTLFTILKLDDKELVFKSQKILGNIKK